MVERFIKGLHENGAEANIAFTDPLKIVTSTLEEEEHYIGGRTTEPPTMRFDFTEHDSRKETD